MRLGDWLRLGGKDAVNATVQQKHSRAISRLEKQTYRLLSAVVVAPVLLATLVVFAWGRLSLLDTATNHYAQFQAQVIADSIGTLAGSGHPDQVADIAHAMSQYPVIGQVAITPLSPDIASYTWSRRDAVLSSGIEVPIQHRGRVLGTLAVLGDTRYLDELARSTLIGFLLFMMLQWILTLVTARQLAARAVLEPIAHIRSAISQLADAQHDNPIPPLHEGNEFDDIIKDIEASRQIVRSILSGLEDTVTRRTQELTEINDQLIITRDEIVQQKRLASLGNLVAGVAHELNTPIGNARLLGTSLARNAEDFVRAAEQGLKRSDFDDYVAMIREATPALDQNLVRASDLINRFKTMSVDQTTGYRRKFSLAEIVEQSLLAMHPRLKKTRITVNTDVPDSIQMDSVPGVYTQVLTNLIENSLVHAFDEGAEGTISISANALDGRLKLVFEDSGHGIPDDRVNRVFEPFYTTRLGMGGSGLGLHIVWSLVNSVGGRVSVDGRPGRGACFTVEAPLELPPGVGEMG